MTLIERFREFLSQRPYALPNRDGKVVETLYFFASRPPAHRQRAQTRLLRRSAYAQLVWRFYADPSGAPTLPSSSGGTRRDRPLKFIFQVNN